MAIRLPSPLRCSSRIDSSRCDLIRFHPGSRHVHRDGPSTHSWGTETTRRQTYETDAPWITWTWLSLDRETRITGHSRMKLTCCICGKSEVIRIRIPRWGPVPIPEGGVHTERHKARERHAHPDRRDPADWVLPFRNMAAFPAGLPLDMFQRVAETAVMENQIKQEDE